MRLRGLIGRLPTLLLLLGMSIFVLSLIMQYAFNRPFGPVSAPFGPVALFGLAIAAVTVLIWLLTMGYMFARQTRQHGAGYAQAYRLMDASQFSEAIPLLEQSVQAGKETVEVLTLLARAHAYTAHYSRAHSLLERAIELYPDNALPYSTLGFLFQLEGNDEQTIAAFQAAVEREGSPVNWAALGFAQVFAGRSALQAFEEASKQPIPAPVALRVYHHLRLLYTQAGDAAKAASAAAKMVSAREGLADWQQQTALLRGTGYAQRLTREIKEIAQALRDADSAQMVD